MIQGPQKIESGELLKYDFIIKNANSLAIQDVQLKVVYPSGSTLENPSRNTNQFKVNLDKIKGKSSQQITSYVKINGPEDTSKIIKATLTYFPPHLNAKLEKSTDLAVDIVSSPLKLAIDAPSLITLNKKVFYTVSLTNQSGNSFQNVRLKITYPEGFIPQDFSPRNPDLGNNIWNLQTIAPREEKEFRIGGILTHNLDIINFNAALELKGQNGQFQPYVKAYSAESFTPPPIKLSIRPTNLTNIQAVNPGTKINFLITFQNTTDSILKDIVLTAELKNQIFDFNSVIPKNQGIYLQDKHKLIWNSRRIPQLALLGPFEKGQTGFQVTIKSFIPLQSYTDKNFSGEITVSAHPKIVPPELSGISLDNSTSFSFKLNSVLKLIAKVLPLGNYPLSVSGPRPPVVSQQTSYLIIWQLLNYYNDLQDVVVESSLPTGVEWEGEWWPQQGNNLEFNPLNGKLSWHIKRIGAGTGFTSPVQQVIFKVSVIPSPTQAGHNLALLNKTTAKGKDAFTGKELTAFSEPLSSPGKVRR